MRYLIAILALAGLIVSCFALREHFRTEPSPCSINEHWDCGVVNHSPFAEIAGVPVAVFGIAGYLAIAGFALARRWWVVLLLTTGAVCFSAYLTYVEARLLETYCIWCVTSAAIISLTEIAAIVALVRRRM
jgi:uncharacterized membrane protein